MALKKTIQTVFGVPAVHWELTDIQPDFDQQSILATLSGYVSKDWASQQNAQPIDQKKFLFAPNTPEGIPHVTFSTADSQDELYGKIYDAIKQHPGWTDAVDDN